MRLREIYDILKDTELKQIVVGESEQAVITYMNLALIEIYGKFNILQEEQIISVVAGQTRYRLQDNSQRVLQVYMRNFAKNPVNGDDAFKEVPLNDINCDDSVYTPQPYVFHVPNPLDGVVYSVMQTVTPPYLTKANLDTVDLIVPPQLLEAILNYAAYRAYKSMNGDEKSEIGSHYKAYMMSCNEILKKGLYNHSIMTNLKATDNGFPTAGGDYA